MVIAFTRQLYILMKAGIPLLKALQIIGEQLPPGRFRNAIEQIVAEIEQGRSFSESLINCPHFFSLFYVNMIKGAEVSGNLVAVLKDLSSHLIQHRRILRQVQTAFLYPAFVLLTAGIILVVLLVFVLPVFIRIFQDIGGTLPPMTQFLIGVSNFMRHWGWTVVVAALLFVGAGFLMAQYKTGKYIISICQWRIPLFGGLLKTMEVGRFCRVTGTLLTSGVTLMKVLEVLLEVTPNALINKAVGEIQARLTEGENLSLAMESTKVFPLSLVKMIQVGEESGKIADIFLDAAEDYENEVSYTISGLLSLLEPALIVVMGAIVGFIVIALFFPILTMSSFV